MQSFRQGKVPHILAQKDRRRIKKKTSSFIPAVKFINFKKVLAKKILKRFSDKIEQSLLLLASPILYSYIRLWYQDIDNKCKKVHALLIA